MAQQQPGRVPSVGDTLTLVIHVAAPAGAAIQARVPADSNVVTMTATPAVVREGDAVRIAYPIAVWAPGHQQVVIPGPILVTMQGRVDTLPDVTVPLTVASVLPGGKPDSGLAPRAARPWLPIAQTSVLPFELLVPAAIMLAVAMHWWWRRHGPALPAAAPAPAAPLLDAARVDAWLAAGEVRLLLEHIAWRVRDRDDFATWRAQADALRFAGGDPSRLEALAREGWDRLQQVAP